MACDKCSAVQKQRKNTNGDRYCRDHQCPYIDPEGKKCSRKKSSKERHCSLNHCRTPPCPHQTNGNNRHCKHHTCQNPGCKHSADRLNGQKFCIYRHKCSKQDCQALRREVVTGGKYIFQDHCEYHTCQNPGCKRSADRLNGQEFCIDRHKCSKQDCQALRRKILTDGKYIFQDHCDDHECQNDSCTACIVEGKHHCINHCCIDDTCLDERLTGLPDQRCLPHHNLTIFSQGKEEGIAEERARLREECARLREDRTYSPIDSLFRWGSVAESFAGEDDLDPYIDQGYMSRPTSERGVDNQDYRAN